MAAQESSMNVDNQSYSNDHFAELQEVRDILSRDLQDPMVGGPADRHLGRVSEPVQAYKVDQYPWDEELPF